VPPEQDDLRQKVDTLLHEHDVRRVNPAAFWGAQFDAGLAWVDFPQERGGLGLSPGLQTLVDEWLDAGGAPSNRNRNPIGVSVAAPTVALFGTHDQQERYLRPLFICEEIWCQLFSEEVAGSDLASVATSADRDGEAWVLNGTKSWVTLGHVADFGLVLARSSRGDRPQEGLTCFILEMAARGVDVVPVRQMTGKAELNEVVLRDVQVPDTRRLGEVGAGWRIAMTTLARERAWLGLRAPARGQGPIAEAVRIWNDRPDKDPVLRDQLMRVWVDAEVTRLLNRRIAHLLPPVGAPTPRAPGPAGAAAKLATAEVNQRIYELCLALLGAGGLLYESYEMDQPADVGLEGKGIHRAFLRSRGSSLEGGTSEIMRTILAERVLGLPKG
jgi:alkylation response protein AidB-like acyl-CoA dehydrogenase